MRSEIVLEWTEIYENMIDSEGDALDFHIYLIYWKMDQVCGSSVGTSQTMQVFSWTQEVLMSSVSK